MQEEIKENKKVSLLQQELMFSNAYFDFCVPRRKHVSHNASVLMTSSPQIVKRFIINSAEAIPQHKQLQSNKKTKSKHAAKDDAAKKPSDHNLKKKPAFVPSEEDDQLEKMLEMELKGLQMLMDHVLQSDGVIKKESRDVFSPKKKKHISKINRLSVSDSSHRDSPDASKIAIQNEIGLDIAPTKHEKKIRKFDPGKESPQKGPRTEIKNFPPPLPSDIYNSCGDNTPSENIIFPAIAGAKSKHMKQSTMQHDENGRRSEKRKEETQSAPSRRIEDSDRLPKISAQLRQYT